VGRATCGGRRRRARATNDETVDGDFQKYATESGAYIREHFFGPDPRLRKMVEHLSDEDLQKLPARARLPEALHRVPRRDRAPWQPHGDLAKDGEGLDARSSVEARNATTR